VEFVLNTELFDEEIKELRIHYHHIFEFLPDAIFMHRAGKILFCNDSAAKLLEVDRIDSLIGEPIFKYVAQDYHEIVKERISETVNEKITLPLIKEKFINSKGKSIDVEVSAKPLFHKNKMYHLVFARDITQCINAEAELKKSEQKYRELFNNVNDAIFVHKVTEDSGFGYFIEVNDVACKTLGYSRDELLRMTVKDVSGSIDNNRFKKVNQQLKANGGYIHQALNKCKDGKLIPVEINSIFYILNGEKYIISICRDISERMKQEQRLKESEELKKSIEEQTKKLNEAVEYENLRTEFFANISHELRTPINVILSTLQLFNLKLSAVDSENRAKLRKYTGTMKQNCYRLVRLVNNLIDTTKIDLGHFNINLINCNIVSVIEEITLSLGEYIHNKGLSIVFDTDTEEKIVACDPDKIERIVLNLISNAVKFTEPGGCISVNVWDRNEKVIISVKDTGIGIPEDKRNMIFEKFIQIDKSLRRNREGSGIGLSIVKALVELHDGSIKVQSECGKGSEFILEFPARIIPNLESKIIENIFNIQDNVEKINIEFSDIYL
jgi:PAS domain S-box-containing protein